MVIKYEVQRHLLKNELTQTEETVIQKYEVCLLIYSATAQVSCPPVTKHHVTGQLVRRILRQCNGLMFKGRDVLNYTTAKTQKSHNADRINDVMGVVSNVRMSSGL